MLFYVQTCKALSEQLMLTVFLWLISNVCLRGSVQNKVHRLSKLKDTKHCSRESFQVHAHPCRGYRIHFLDLFNLLCFSNQLPKTLPGDWTHSNLKVQATHSPVPSPWENLTFQKRFHADEETWQTHPSQTTAQPWTASSIFGRMCKQRFPSCPCACQGRGRTDHGAPLTDSWADHFALVAVSH